MYALTYEILHVETQNTQLSTYTISEIQQPTNVHMSWIKSF